MVWYLNLDLDMIAWVQIFKKIPTDHFYNQFTVPFTHMLKKPICNFALSSYQNHLTKFTKTFEKALNHAH